MFEGGAVMPRKGENIYRRKDNRWEARHVKGYSCNGKTLYGYCYGTTYREAKEKVNIIKAALISGQMIQKSNRVCLSVICDQWLQLNRNKVKESSYVKYCTNIEKHIKPAIGEYSVQAVNSIVIEHTKDCNLEGVHYHVLRHTFATRCVEVGFEIKSLSEVLGHSSPRITLERYVHSSMELKRDNMEKLSAIGY